MRRLVVPLALMALLAATGLPLASGAPAAPEAAAGSCHGASAYPPAADATLQVDTTDPAVGETIKVSGRNFCPDEDVDISIDGRHAVTTHSDPDGAFDPTVRVPGPAGSKRVCGVGASGAVGDRGCLTIVARAGNAAGRPGTASGRGNPAMTGVEIALLGVLALVLVVGGVLFTTLGRHRKLNRG
jgi:hypothetical protein